MSFPNFKNKHARESMIAPREFLRYQKRIGEYPKFKPPQGIIFCYSGRLLEYILKNHETVKTRSFSGDLYLLKDTKGRIGVMANFGIGAPVVGTILEELIAFGVKKFVTVGWAGTLQKNIKIGDIVVCEKAIRDEGASHHYLKPSKYAYASVVLSKKIEKTFDDLGGKYVVGTSWTIDAPYRETVAEAKKYQKEGVATVEMEAAALFAIARYRKIKMGAIFMISDSLAELKWKPKFHLSNKNRGIVFESARRSLLEN